MRSIRVIPLGLIVGGSLLASYLLCFVLPVFLNSAQEMAFPHYLPSISPIGADLRLACDFSKAWASGVAPDIPSLVYPPLERVLRLPLLLFPFQGAYAVQTLATLFAYSSVILLLPRLLAKCVDWTALSVLAMAGLFSYGLQFELERGQSNVIAVALVAWSLMLFHYSGRLRIRLLAYVLFSCAIQLKLYPAVFVLGFTRDAHDWRRNVLRWGVLGAANIASLFALGWEAFGAFWSTLTQNSSGFVNFSNHSISSFAQLMQKMADGYTPQQYCPGEVAAAGAHFRSLLPDAWLHDVGAAVLVVCASTLLCCFAAVLAMAYRRNDRASYKYLIIMCCLVGLLAPSVSMDYKLSALILAFAFMVSESAPISLTEGRSALRISLYFVASSCLALTLYPPDFRPLVLRMSTPLLLGMAIVFTLLMIVEKPHGTLAVGQNAQDPKVPAAH